MLLSVKEVDGDANPTGSKQGNAENDFQDDVMLRLDDVDTSNDCQDDAYPINDFCHNGKVLI